MNHLIQKKNWKKSLQCCSGPPSWASGSWWPSCTSCKSWRGQIHPKFLISHQFRAHYRNTKLKYKIFLLFINNFSQNAFWNLKPLNQPACQIRTPLHCECNISVTMAGIIKWLGYTIHTGCFAVSVKSNTHLFSDICWRSRLPFYVLTEQRLRFDFFEKKNWKFLFWQG